MDILVYGAGAIGGYIGSRLLLSGQQVVMLDRPELASRINREGVLLKEAGQQERLKPEVVTSMAEAMSGGRQFDLIILGLKSYDLGIALDDLSRTSPDVSTILTIQNGIGVEEPFIERFGAERILAASLTTPVSKEKPNILVVERSDRGLGLAPTHSGQDIGQWLSLFQGADIETVSLADYESMKWSKAMLNMVGNATAAILDMSPGDIYRSDESYDLEVQMLREMLAVMKAKGLQVLNLPGPSVTSLASALRIAPRFILKPVLTRIVAKGRGDKMPSFYIDLVSNRGKSEVVFHNGAVARAGKETGVLTPVNQVLNDVLLQLTNGDLDRQSFYHNPARLVSKVKKAIDLRSREG